MRLGLDQIDEWRSRGRDAPIDAPGFARVPWMSRARGMRIACVAAAAWLVASAARAESGLVLAYPAVFETIAASTYDESGQRVGSAHLVIEKLDGGNVRILSESRIDGGARTIATADLAPIDGGRGLQLQVEESRSFSPDGDALGVLRIDHRDAVVSCIPPSGNGASVQTLELPGGDRIANVPLNLLFLPLVQGDVDTVEFQFVLCRGGARLLDFEARVARRENGSNGSGGLVEVRYGPDYGKLISLIGRRLMPRLAFWFDPEAPNPWLAHRLPLYSRGPEVLVVREGVPTSLLTEEH